MSESQNEKEPLSSDSGASQASGDSSALAACDAGGKTQADEAAAENTGKVTDSEGLGPLLLRCQEETAALLSRCFKGGVCDPEEVAARIADEVFKCISEGMWIGPVTEGSVRGYFRSVFKWRGCTELKQQERRGLQFPDAASRGQCASSNIPERLVGRVPFKSDQESSLDGKFHVDEESDILKLFQDLKPELDDFSVRVLDLLLENPDAANVAIAARLGAGYTESRVRRAKAKIKDAAEKAARGNRSGLKDQIAYLAKRAADKKASRRRPND